LMKEESHRLRSIVQSFARITESRFHTEDKRLHTAIHRLINGTNRAVASGSNRIDIDRNKLGSSVKSLLQAQADRIKYFEQDIRLLDPVNVLKRGYSITYLDNKAITRVSELSEWDIIQTKLYKGSIRSRVERINEEE
jgi:exodeoxyribonuclease VII large subunit